VQTFLDRCLILRHLDLLVAANRRKRARVERSRERSGGLRSERSKTLGNGVNMIPAPERRTLTTQRESILTGFRRRLASYPELFRHSRKLDNRFSFHFVHNLPAMHFNGDFAAA